MRKKIDQFYLKKKQQKNHSNSFEYSAAIPFKPSTALVTSVWPRFCSRPVQDRFCKNSPLFFSRTNKIM